MNQDDASRVAEAKKEAARIEAEKIEANRIQDLIASMNYSNGLGDTARKKLYIK